MHFTVYIYIYNTILWRRLYHSLSSYQSQNWWLGLRQVGVQSTNRPQMKSYRMQTKIFNPFFGVTNRLPLCTISRKKDLYDGNNGCSGVLPTMASSESFLWCAKQMFKAELSSGWIIICIHTMYVKKWFVTNVAIMICVC